MQRASYSFFKLLANHGPRAMYRCRLTPVLATRREIHNSHMLMKKMKKEWVVDPAQREVDAILASERVSGPTKKPLKLFTFEDEDLGEMKKFEAERLAEEKNLKLVPIDQNSNPMIFKLMTGKQLVDFNRSQKKTKKKDTKKLQLTLNISDHDLTMKFKHVTEWLNHGHSVQIEVKSKKLASDPDVGSLQADMFKRLTENFGELATVHQSTRTEASLRVTLVNKIVDKSEH